MVDNIRRIDVLLKTGNRPGAAGRGWLNLGIGGREFRVTQGTPNIGDSKVYVLGDGSNIQFSDRNDPRRDYIMTTKDLELHPLVYLRYEDYLGSDDVWNLEKVIVTCNPGPSEINYQNLEGEDNNIWLGDNAGFRLYLHKKSTANDNPDNIRRIDVLLKTGNRPGAAGPGWVILEIGGRDFRVTKGTPNIGDSKVYVLGDGSNIILSDRNDPRRDYPMTTKDLELHPFVYLRYYLSSNDDVCNLEKVIVTCNPGPSEINYQNLEGEDNNIWLGGHTGSGIFLHKKSTANDNPDNIRKIDVYLKTGNRPGAAGRGSVILGIGGREFRVTEDKPDIGDSKVYTLGADHNIEYSDRNDPRRDYIMTTKDLELHPFVYINYLASGWNLENIRVTCNPGPSEINYQNLEGEDNNIWLGEHAGFRLYLHKR